MMVHAICLLRENRTLGHSLNMMKHEIRVEDEKAFSVTCTSSVVLVLYTLHIVMVYLQCSNLTSGTLKNFFTLFVHVFVEFKHDDVEVALVLLCKVDRLVVISNLLELS